MKQNLFAFLGLSALLAVGATPSLAGGPDCGAPVAGPPAGGAPASPAGKDIVQTAIDAGSFGTLVKAVQAAGLVETLKGPGPFTVFAPTDAAFAAVPSETLQGLLADKAALTRC